MCWGQNGLYGKREVRTKNKEMRYDRKKYAWDGRKLRASPKKASGFIDHGRKVFKGGCRIWGFQALISTSILGTEHSVFIAKASRRSGCSITIGNGACTRVIIMVNLLISLRSLAGKGGLRFPLPKPSPPLLIQSCTLRVDS